MTQTYRVLILEDDADLAEELQLKLEQIESDPHGTRLSAKIPRLARNGFLPLHGEG